jgi:hypothetical protein
VLRRGDRELTFGPNYADANRFALFFGILQTFFLCVFLRLEGPGQVRELPADIFEEEPSLSEFGHEKFMAHAATGRSNGLVAPSQRHLDF